MAKRPAFQFYKGDYIRSEAAACSLAAQGLWLRMLIVMDDSDECGYLVRNGKPLPDAAISRLVGAESIAEYQTLLAELRDAGVYSLDSRGVIFSRRMVRDEQTRNGAAGRQAKLRANGGGDPYRWSAIRVTILERDKFMCAYCGRAADTVDHILPKSCGGNEDLTNLVACCKRCNNTKTNRTPSQAGMTFWSGFTVPPGVTLDVTPIVTPRVTSEYEEEDEVEEETEVAVALEVQNPLEGACEMIYAAYPRKVGRPKALEAIRKAIVRHMKAAKCEEEDACQYIHQAVLEYARSPDGKRGEFVPYPATWFNQERYSDNRQEWYRNGQTSKSEQRTSSNIANIAAGFGFTCEEPGTGGGALPHGNHEADERFVEGIAEYLDGQRD